jgi:DNA-directed RNA polymerase specialized sigma24 family protein
MHRTTLTDLAETDVATRAARGDRAAFDELRHRHGPLAWRLAVVAGTGATQAENALAEGLARTVAKLTAAPSTHPLRLDLLAATRTASLAEPTAQERGSDAPDGWPPAPADATDDELRLLGAYRCLPEHYRSTLWLLESERLEAHHASLVLGLPTDAVGLLHLRARAGLRQALSSRQLEALTAQGAEGACQRATGSLSASRTGRLAAADRRNVDRHLERCAPCRDRLAELDAAPLALRSVIEVPTLPGPDAAWARFRALTDAAEVRPLGLVLPGGRPVPLWAERALAGAAAAAISLGIAGAIAMGARGEAGPGQGRAPETAAQTSDGTGQTGQTGAGTGAPSGPVTAAPLDPVVLDAAPPPPRLGSGTAPGGSGGSGGSSPASGDGGTAPVRGTSGSAPATPAPSEVADPAPTQPAPSSPPESTAPEPEPDPAPPADEPGGGLDVDLGDLGLSIGEDCTGIKVGGTTAGCESAGGTDHGTQLQLDDATDPLLGLGG